MATLGRNHLTVRLVVVAGCGSSAVAGAGVTAVTDFFSAEPRVAGVLLDDLVAVAAGAAAAAAVCFLPVAGCVRRDSVTN